MGILRRFTFRDRIRVGQELGKSRAEDKELLQLEALLPSAEVLETQINETLSALSSSSNQPEQITSTMKGEEQP